MEVTNASPSHPKLKRLAAKPLKLAASSLRPLGLSRANSSTTIPSLDASTASTGVESLSVDDTSSTSTRKWGRKRHSHGQLTPAQIAAAARGPRKPLEGEEPAAWVKVRVVKADGLIAKDRNGTSDPFVTLLLPPSGKGTTPVMKKTLDPKFPVEGSTFEFPLYLSLAGVVGGRGIEGVIWDKDLMRKEYMGEISFPMTDWFPPGEVKLWSDDLPLLTRRVISTRRRHAVSGTVSLQIGFVHSKEAINADEPLRKARMVYSTIIDQSSFGRGMAGVLGVPAHQGIGTVKMRSSAQHEPAPLAPSAEGVSSKSTMALLHSATAAVVTSMAGKHQMQPVPNNAGLPPHGGDDFEDEYDVLADDGLSSSSSSDEYESALEEEDEERLKDSFSEDNEVPQRPPLISTPSSSSDIVPRMNDNKRLSVPDASIINRSITTTPKATKTTPSGGGGYFDKVLRQDSTDSGSAPGTPMGGVSTPGGSKRKIFSKPKIKVRSKKKDSSGYTKKDKDKDKDFELSGKEQKDVLGIVVLEIKSASDLPKLKNALRVSFDMDPFVVISFGKKVFRTRVIRHSLNPSWDEKMLFHVRRHESSYTLQFSVLDWDKVSGNDMVGTCTLPLEELLSDAPKPNEDTGLYAKNEDGKHEFKEFTLPISTEKDMPWESKHSPKLTIRAKYEPYDALRQRFWRQYITQYDADDTGTMSYTELSAMLDSLGSTLTRHTIEGYFSSCNKSADKDELEIDELIQCLEREVNKPRTEKAIINVNGKDGVGSTGIGTPSMAPEPARDGLGMIGPTNISSPVDATDLEEKLLASQKRDQEVNDNGDTAIPGNLKPAEHDLPTIRLRQPSNHITLDSNSTATSQQMGVSPPTDNSLPPSHSGTVTPGLLSDTEADPDGDHSSSGGEDIERVINIRVCPLCHRPRLKRKSEQDIVTHLAICASNDWSRVDRIVTANYVTSSQAQRKFLTKLMNKVTIGAYSLGANSANILVQDRMTGQLQEEKMAVYVRLGIRVLYKGWRGQMEGARARRLLKSLSVKQGIKYDSPASAADIPAFIAFHNLNVDEILDPLDSFKTFNEFFYRKIKAESRPVSEPDNPGRMVSCADCRMMAFESVEEATKVWIKGREFSVGRLLGTEYKDIWHKYDGGALGIFRLAPQDYHRFHSPVKGQVGKMTLIDGEYYTVNPQAIRTMLDVYGENVRKVVPVHTEDFGTVMTVWIGAMMVGSILTTVKEGQMVDRADELGYFAFGGSTIVCLFEKGALQWDEDLLNNGKASIETLVRMGSGIGRSTRKKA